jgi:hypothetical protein
VSLVHEALEKAKREASAKSARDLGLPEPTGQPFRARRSRHPLVLGGVAALTAVVVTGMAYWLFRPMFVRTPTATPVTRTTPADATAPAPPLSPASTAPSVPEVATAPAVSSAAAAPPSPETAESPAASVSTLPASEPAAPTARPAPPAAEPTPSYRRQVTLADGTVIQLGGIAWSEEAPLAYLNGKLYVRGERVAGLRVERIERERVLLVGADGARLFVTLR